jgi:hypothetical protein
LFVASVLYYLFVFERTTLTGPIIHYGTPGQVCPGPGVTTVVDKNPEESSGVFLSGPRPYKFIGFGDIHGLRPYRFIGFGDIHGPRPYKFIRYARARADKAGSTVVDKKSGP